MKLSIVCSECYRKLKTDGGYTNLDESVLIIPTVVKHQCKIKEDKKRDRETEEYINNQITNSGSVKHYELSGARDPR